MPRSIVRPRRLLIVTESSCRLGSSAEKIGKAAHSHTERRGGLAIYPGGDGAQDSDNPGEATLVAPLREDARARVAPHRGGAHAEVL